MKNNINILIIEDDNDINNLLYEMLNNEGYYVKSAYSGTEALIYLKEKSWQLILLDLMLPGKSGEELLLNIREKCKMPVIIISAKEELGIKAKTLRAGADDFITKPFDIDEVLARVEANLRRYMEFSKGTDYSNIMSYKELTIDEDSRIVRVNETEINLTGREFHILELFLKYPTKVFSKANLFKSVWGENFLCDDNTITVHISNLRNKIIKAGAKEEYIKTIWGIGYKLDVS
ncbi:response regulator transcription factor [Clostridium tarantellae]|uniref:Stage 0 sporulation protein A homolog n=1 Tax=Clostridium tarantellae TaxID=39493 RepID=A0A6I1MKR6_9CLOT|nr:response regulator transcription factor [Clostridium tarantellae]MPQ43574.1 response regulator [Clostridium tarantellae]